MSPGQEKIGCLGALLRLFFGGDGKKTAIYPYRVRDDFLSPAELSLYHVLTHIIGTQAVVMTKVRLADLFFVQHPRANRASLNRIISRHVDFLVCHPQTMRPLFGIELDDASHARADRVARDEFVNRAFSAAGLPLMRITAQHAYNTREIAEKIRPFLGIAVQTQPAVESAQVPTVAPAPYTPVQNVPPVCPKCGGPMVVRTGSKGAYQGQRFYGCSNYPRCHTILPLEQI